MSAVITVDKLTRDYGEGKGVFDLSFFVEKGEAFGFLGPNGAGKSTTIRHLMGFLKPMLGSCKINGMDCWSNREKIQTTLGYIPGEIAFFDDMSGTTYLNFLKKYRNLQKDRCEELLKRFDLNASGKIKKMSKGTKQKVGIVAAFMHDPDILILDEPTSGLDPLMQNRFIELVLEEKSRGKTILMSSHMFEEVERTCHRVGIIRKGKMCAVESVDALKASQVKRFVVTFSSQTEAKKFSSEFSDSLAENNRVTATVKNNICEFLSTLAKHKPVNLSAPAQSLEEVFLQYYGGENA